MQNGCINPIDNTYSANPLLCNLSNSAISGSEILAPNAQPKKFHRHAEEMHLINKLFDDDEFCVGESINITCCKNRAVNITRHNVNVVVKVVKTID